MHFRNTSQGYSYFTGAVFIHNRHNRGPVSCLKKMTVKIRTQLSLSSQYQKVYASKGYTWFTKTSAYLRAEWLY